jgi:predicted exporter
VTDVTRGAGPEAERSAGRGPLVVGLSWALAVAALAGYTARSWAVSTDITRFMADPGDVKMAAISRDLADSELARTWIVSVRGADEAESVAAARELRMRLSDVPGLFFMDGSSGGGEGEAIHALYFPRRFFFFVDDPGAALSEAGLRAAARAVLLELSSPTAPLIKQIAGADPLLLYPGLLRRLMAAQTGSLRPVEDALVSEDGAAIVFLGTTASPFESAAMQPLAAAIEGAFIEVAAAHEGRLRLEQSAVARFALAAEASIRADVARISTISTLGLVGLFLLFFRSLRLIALVAAPLAFGVLAGLAATLGIFGEIHGVTLAFGATLIGVAIDYSVHLLNHHMLAAETGGAEACARRLWPGLALGALTTVAGFIGLAWTSFPGLREMAVFASVGVLGALAATRWALPALLPRRPQPGRAALAAAAGLRRLVGWMHERRRALLVGPAAAALVMAIGLPRVVFVDDVQALASVDAELLAEDERVRALVSRMDAGRFVVAIGGDEEEALARNDAVFERLTAAQAAGSIEALRSLHTLVPSAATQQARWAALRADPSLPARINAAFVAEGFKDGALAPFVAALAADPPPPLRPGDLLEGSPLAGIVRASRVTLGDEVGIVTLVRGVTDPEALRGALAGLEGVYVFDQGATMAAAYRGFRRRTIELAGVGLCAVFLLVLGRYRRLRVAAAAFAPALVAAGTTVGILGIVGAPLNLMHVVALLLVMSMGVDYGVFLAESRADPRGLAATVLSLVIACASTVLAFGLLGMSSSPALQALGTTVGIGVLLSLVLAPLTLVLLVRGEGEAR